MIKLYQFQRTWGIPNLSHFCVKVETYLRMAGIPYELVNALPLNAPRGKLPYIEDQGRKISDSRLIVRYLQDAFGNTLDARLSPAENAVATSFRRLVEEHLYWVSMYTRWSYTEANWQINKRAIFGVLPPVARDLAAAAYRYRIKGQIRGHGMGRLSADEVFELGREDIDALADYLGDKPYFLGDKPTSLDASVFGILVNTIECPIESPMKDHALTKTNLSRYCSNILSEFYPDLSPGR